MSRQLALALIVGIVWATVPLCEAADVRFTVSSRETYVGAAIRIQVIIEGAQAHEAPGFPAVEGAEVRELQQDDQTDLTTVLPGSSDRPTITYTYEVIPQVVGELMIPPISVIADGESFSTSPMRIVAKESQTGDLLYLRLMAKRRSFYVGEPIDATLEVWLKLYRVKGIRMSAEEMWRYVINEEASTFGAFAKNLQPQARNIAYRIETQLDEHENAKEYCVYSMQQRVWAERPGTFDAGGLSVHADYPLRVRRSPVTLLGRPFEVVDSRPISATIEDSDIVVIPLPTQARPDSFQGAVGQYTMVVTAEPTEVRVGDPIVLSLVVRGIGRLDTLHAPLLARQEPLTSDFRVPDEELAGIVSGAAKKFSQTIRAKRHDVTQIPPIEFSYFDPSAEQYVTLESNPIPLNVEESTRPLMSQIADNNSLFAPPTELTIVDSGLLANYDDLESLLCQQSPSFGASTWLFLAFGPMLYATGLLLGRYHAREVGNASLRRRRSARRTAIAALRRASTEAGKTTQASRVATAVRGYVADRFNLPHAVTGDEVVQQLQIHNVPEAVVGEVRELLSVCEAIEFSATQDRNTGELIDRARACVDELEKETL